MTGGSPSAAANRHKPGVSGGSASIQQSPLMVLHWMLAPPFPVQYTRVDPSALGAGEYQAR